MIPNSPNASALTAYRYAVYGLIPIVGLILGPAAIVLGIYGLRYYRTAPLDHSIGHARAAIILGLLELLTNAIGLTLIGIGVVSLTS